jgi:hypothetical protein
LVPNPPEGVKLTAEPVKLTAELVVVAVDETLVDELLVVEVAVDETLVDELLVVEDCVNCARVVGVSRAKNTSTSAL